MSINISIIIPNYNGATFISPCLKSLKAAINNCKKSRFEIILVDNNSTDNSRQVFQQYFKEKIIKNKQNFGFAKAVNIGIKSAKYKYVCLLNNDLKLNKDWFKLIINAIETYPLASAFCGTVLNYNGTKIESQGFKFYYSGKCENVNNGMDFNKNYTTSPPYPVWGSSAAAVVYDKAILKKIGLFDESFFAYIEDVDLSFRLAKIKKMTILNPLAVSLHLGGQTSSKMGNLRAKYTLINWVKLIYKNYSKIQIIQYLPFILIERLRNLSYYLRSSIIIKIT